MNFLGCFSIVIVFLYISASPVIPISDIKGVDAAAYTKAEKVLRCKLAALYRTVDLMGWSQGIYNHISVSNLVQKFTHNIQRQKVSV